MRSSSHSTSARRHRGAGQIPVCDTCAGLLDAVLGVTSRIPHGGTGDQTLCALCGRPARVRAESKHLRRATAPYPGDVEVTRSDHLVRLVVSGDIDDRITESIFAYVATTPHEGDAILVDLLNARAPSAGVLRVLVEQLVETLPRPAGLVVRLGQLPGRAHARALTAGWIVTESEETAERELARMSLDDRLRAPND